MGSSSVVDASTMSDPTMQLDVIDRIGGGDGIAAGLNLCLLAGKRA